MTLNNAISELLTIHAAYSPASGPSLVTLLALRVRELEAAIRQHHNTHHQHGKTPVLAPHNVTLYDAAGIKYRRPEAWHLDPSWHRLAGMRAHIARQVDAITAGDPVRVDNVPEQMA